MVAEWKESLAKNMLEIADCLISEHRKTSRKQYVKSK
jgi:hypothetical protein